jgi:O-antigen ligase
MGLLYSIVTVVTVINNGWVASALSKIKTIVLITAIVDMYKERMRCLLTTLLVNFEFCIYINLFTLIFYPNGFFSRYNNAYGNTVEWFLGAKNNFLLWVIPSVLIAWLYKEYTGTAKRCYFLTSAIIITELICGSSTAIVGVFGILLCYNFPKLYKWITPFRGMVIGIALIVSIVLFQSFDYLSFILEEVLDKDMTFNNRLFIWNNAIGAIRENTLFGAGIMDSLDVVNVLGYRSYEKVWLGATHAHNHILQMLFQCGLVGFLIFLYVFMDASRKCTRFWKNRIAQICGFALITHIIIGISENLDYALLYLCIIIPCYLPELVGQNANEEPEKNKIRGDVRRLRLNAQ